MLQIGSVDAHYPVDHDGGVYQITAYGTAPVHGENDEDPTPIGVFCVNHNGVPTDTRFSVSYSHGVNVLGTSTAFGNVHARHSWVDPTFYAAGWANTAGGVPTFVRLAEGRYRVHLPGAGDLGRVRHGRLARRPLQLLHGGLLVVERGDGELLQQHHRPVRGQRLHGRLHGLSMQVNPAVASTVRRRWVASDG